VTLVGAVTVVTKGAPETVLERCVDVPPSARAALAAEFAAATGSSPSPPARPRISVR
jgi:hypothetical protein